MISVTQARALREGLTHDELLTAIEERIVASARAGGETCDLAEATLIAIGLRGDQSKQWITAQIKRTPCHNLLARVLDHVAARGFVVTHVFDTRTIKIDWSI